VRSNAYSQGPMSSAAVLEHTQGKDGIITLAGDTPYGLNEIALAEIGELYLNECGAEQDGPKAKGLMALVKDLKAQGVPIDGVGFQTHVHASARMAALGDMMRRVAPVDVDVAITELDVRVPLPVDAISIVQQADVYGGAAQACLSTPRCRSITMWGFTDAVSWIPAHNFGYGAATLLDASLAAKPAYHQFARALSRSTTLRPFHDRVTVGSTSHRAAMGIALRRGPKGRVCGPV
jgi:hypothetical protein